MGELREATPDPVRAGPRRRRANGAFQHALTRTFLHDLRTPLTIISGYADLLRSGTLGPGPAAGSALQAIQDQVARIQQVSGDFALASGAQAPAGDVGPVDLVALLRPGLEADGVAVSPVPSPLPLAMGSQASESLVRALLRALRHLAEPEGPVKAAFNCSPRWVSLTVTVPCRHPPLDTLQRVLDRQPPASQRSAPGWTLTLAAVAQGLRAQGGRLAVRHHGPALECRLRWRRAR